MREMQRKRAVKMPEGQASAQSAIIGLGIPSLVFGLGFAMIPLNFWAGIGLMTLSLPLFWWMLFHVFTKDEKNKRSLGFIASIGVYGAILWAIWVPASIDALLASDPGNYAEGTDIYGIKWKPNFSELTVALTNDSGNDFANLDIYVRTDLAIARIGMASGINICASEPYFPAFIAAGQLTFTDGQGKQHATPAFDKNRPVTSSVYRIRCDRLMAKSEVEIRLAVVDFTQDREKK